MTQTPDTDPIETREWIESLTSVVHHAGRSRGVFLLRALEQYARNAGLSPATAPYSAYRNTISVGEQEAHPGEVEIEERLTAMMRWNALAMVVRANRAYGELGGHIASYASAAEIFEVGFNHFFRGPQAPQGGDLVFFQPHSAPGVYARAFLEGRLEESHLAHYRQEVSGQGLCSYPHPWLMPHFWQFPTGSMGIGPINAIYQARFMRYLAHRGLAQTDQRHVWGVFGDGEMDEPESIGALTLAARENLDNLTFVINRNLQRLDGPVRGNGSDHPGTRRRCSPGAGWNVIKLLWGSNWDALFARDTRGRAGAPPCTKPRSMASIQTLGPPPTARFNREPLLSFKYPGRCRQWLVQHLSSDADIDAAASRGGHDPVQDVTRPTMPRGSPSRRADGDPGQDHEGLRHGLGGPGESRMTTHQQKKLDNAEPALHSATGFGLAVVR